MSEIANEVEIIQTVHGALEPLDDEARSRILTYITSLLDISARVVGGQTASAEKDIDEEDADDIPKQASTFSTFAELYAAADPKSNGEKALVAGYWLQVCQDAEKFTGAAANKELTHLGYKLANITEAIGSMQSKKPSLMLQLKKSGNSKQGRKLYKVSHAGVKHIEEMVGG